MAHQLIKELGFQLFQNPKCFSSTQEPDLGIWGHRTERSAKALGANPKAFLMLPDDMGKPIPGKGFRRSEEFLDLSLHYMSWEPDPRSNTDDRLPSPSVST